MKRLHVFPAFLLLSSLLLMANTSSAQDFTSRVTDYLISSHSEVSDFNEVLWYFHMDLVVGPVRSNDQIGIKSSPVFLDEVITSAPGFLQGPGYDPDFFGPPPTFNAPIMQALVEPHTIDSLMVSATTTGTYFENEEGAWQSRIEATISGWHLTQWQAGVPYPDDEGFLYTDHYIPYSYGTAIFVEGRLEIFGRHVAGIMTVACDGDMYLIDDITYAGYGPRSIITPLPDPTTRWVIPTPFDMLGLVADGNILVANTEANGRGNGGLIGEADDHSNKHIMITAAMFSQNGSFTIENHNNSPSDPNGWDGYFWCDPEGDYPGMTDERGKIYLHGLMSYQRRGYVHRSNCAGTGYDKAYLFDHRFRGGDFPGIHPANVVDLTENVTWQDTVLTLDSADDRLLLGGTGTLTLGPGTVINIDNTERDWHYAFWGGRVTFEGTEENPVRIVLTGERDEPFRLFHYTETEDVWSHVVFEGPNLVLEVPPTLIGVSIIGDAVLLKARTESVAAQFENCTFRGLVMCDARLTVQQMTGCVVEGSFSGAVLEVDRSTFVHLAHFGNNGLVLTASHLAPLENRDVRNTVFKGPYENLFISSSTATIDYCAWHGAGEVNFHAGIIVGTHNLADQDPLFWDAVNGDYHLTENSPLIDAGDPDGPLDPDGTRADIGAFPYDPTYTETPETDPSTGQPLEFAVENLYPNPFNGMTTLSLTLPRSGEVRVTVFDVLGREVVQLHQGRMAAGRQVLALNLATQPSGLYFVVAEAGRERVVAKAMLVK